MVVTMELVDILQFLFWFIVILVTIGLKIRCNINANKIENSEVKKEIKDKSFVNAFLVLLIAGVSIFELFFSDTELVSLSTAEGAENALINIIALTGMTLISLMMTIRILWDRIIYSDDHELQAKCCVALFRGIAAICISYGFGLAYIVV